MFRLRATFTAFLVLQAGLGAGCGGMTQDGPGGTGGGPVDGSSDTGGSGIVLDGYFPDDGIIYDGEGGWGAGSTGGGGTGGQPVCLECFPHDPSCLDGTVYYQFAFGSACPPDTCTSPQHVCALGCPEGEGVHEEELTFTLCEELRIRGPGFPCRADIDCATPVGATVESTLNDPTTGLGGASSGSDELHCSEAGVCAFGVPPAPMDDFGETCGIQTYADQPGPVVGLDDACGSGACLMLEGGHLAGACTVSCETHDDCPDGYGCVDVLDDRYFAWGYVPYSIPPPRILACVPGSE